MGKKQKNKAKSKSNSPITKGLVITVAVIALAIAGGVYYLWISSVPVNENHPVFTTASNVYILAIHNADGYSYDEQSTKTGKKSISGTNTDPPIHISQGTLVALHVINEDKDTGSDQDLNIDAFNVHTRHLKYFEAQTINFVADKIGNFPYYSKIHPEMNGTFTVDP